MLTKLKTNYTDGIEVTEWIALATDDKPEDVGNGSKLYTIDEGATYYYSATDGGWVKAGAAKYLRSIAITTAPTKVEYTEGETFDPTGAVVKATYSDNSNATVSSSCEWIATDPLTVEDTSALCVYIENGLRRTATQAITVSEAEEEPADDDNGGEG